MKNSSLILLLALLGGTALSFLTTPSWGGLPKDEDIRKSIQAMAAKNQEAACQFLGIPSNNDSAVSQVQAGIAVLGGRKVEDITRTSWAYNWTHGNETLDSTYHIRCGDGGFYFELSMETKDRQLSSVDLEFEKTEANPWEVAVINFCCRHGVLLLVLLFAFMLLGALAVVGLVRHFMGKSKKPPKIP